MLSNINSLFHRIGSRVMNAPNIEYGPNPSRDEVDALEGPVVLNFGTNWCGHCQGAAPAITAALRDFPSVQHIGIEDGPGRKLGRSLTIKLWPTLIFMKDGQEQTRLIRPTETNEIRDALRSIT
jgi:thioredoxin 1